MKIFFNPKKHHTTEQKQAIIKAIKAEVYFSGKGWQKIDLFCRSRGYELEDCIYEN